MHTHVLLEDLILTFCLQKKYFLLCSFKASSTFSDGGSLSLSPSCSWRGQGEWPRSWWCQMHAAHRYHRAIVALDLLKRQRHSKPNIHKKVPKDYRQSRRNLDMVNTTCTVPQSFLFPSLEASRFHHKEEKKRWSIVAVIGGKSLTSESDSPSSSDLPARESEPDRHQGSSSHMLNHRAFSVLSWGGAPRTAKIHRLGEDSGLRTCTAGRNYTDPRHFFKNKKKIEKNISMMPR